jgi:hypothetical protein
MNVLTIRVLVLLMVFGLEAIVSPATDNYYSLVVSGSAQAADQFVVFDGTWHKEKPDLSKYGLKPITIIESQLWDNPQMKDYLPNKTRVPALAEHAMAAGGIAILDIEHWPMKGDHAVVSESLSRYSTVLQWFHQALPGLKVGYYGVPPIRDYWRAVKGPTAKEYLAWQAENDALQSLASEVDILFPSLYTFYPEREGWVDYAIAQIREARRYGNGKPVYVFLWPAYHESNALLGGSSIEPGFWKLQLETARIHADGIVIWGGGGSLWNEQAPWWKITKAFMQSSEQSVPTPPNSLIVR